MATEQIPSPPKSDRRQARLERFERRTELPLMLLAFAMIPVLLGHWLFDLTTEEQRLLVVLDIAIWALFAVDLGVKLAVAPHRVAYLKRRWLHVLIVVLPFFRPLVVVRLVLYGSRTVAGMRSLLGVSNLVVGVAGLVFVGATVVLTVEQRTNPSIDSLSDALWWALTTISTVGYGDAVPVTPVGRLVAVVLMVGGIVFFSALAGNLAAVLVRSDRGQSPEHNDDPEASLSDVLREVRALREEVTELRAGYPRP